MTTAEQIKAEVEKLTKSQRAKLRAVIGPGAIEALEVNNERAYTIVRATLYGFKNKVVLSSRGRVISHEVLGEA